jgi:phenylalanyl-tRNA synthetase beta chain
VRAPLSWLREYAPGLPATASALEVAADLVRVGLEEEAIHGGTVTGPLVVGEVLDFAEEPQKNGKIIRWCQVNVGSYNVDGQPRGIVCGANNFVKGDKIVAVLPGAVLPTEDGAGFTISARKTYGHVSDGMICSADELGLSGDHADGIIRLSEWGLDAAEPGDDAISLLGLGEQTVEVNVTPDRGYALSLRGIAREYSHATGTPFADPAAIEAPAPSADGLGVLLADDAPIHGVPGCNRYVARIVRGVDVQAAAPQWMQRRLEQAGMRSISLAVDVTNYVMLAVGHPLHAFDLGGLAAPIVVRRAQAGEKLTTLDGVARTLHPEDLLITDSPSGAGSRVLALAGVMGGASSEVTTATTDLLIESAYFEPITVARTSRRHKLSTEASRRYERGVDSDLAARAAQLAVQLLIEFGGGQAGPVTDAGAPLPGASIRMPWDLPNRLAGVQWSLDDVVSTLTLIGCEVTVEQPPLEGTEVRQGAELVVQAPSWRPDLRIGADLVEEVARLRGYELIPSKLPVPPPGRGLTHAQRVRRSVARSLAEHGLTEVLTYPFMAASVSDAFGLPDDDPRRNAARLANPLSEELPYLRTSVLATLSDAVRRNLSRGFTDLALFEIGLVTRPEPGAPPAPALPVGQLPTPEQFAALAAAVPAQPRRVAIMLTGLRQPATWNAQARPADWSDALDVALLVARTQNVEPVVSQDVHAPWHPGRCARLEIGGQLFGHAGELHPAAAAALGLPARTVAAELDLGVLTAASGAVVPAEPISAFPLAKEDVALVADDTVPAGAIEAALVQGAGELLESIRLFDVYTGPPIDPGQRSLAFALRLRAPDRTLTAQEAAAARDAAVARATALTGAVLRGT